MPWNERCRMDERMRFVARLIEGHGMAELCREFGISRKTGYKIWDRYKSVGLEGLTDRSRRPTPGEQASRAGREHHRSPSQRETHLGSSQDPRAAGAPVSPGEDSGHQHHPCRPGPPRTRRPSAKEAIPKPQGTVLVPGKAPNDLWCADYKGEFLLGNRRYCYPLTITDFSSRYLLACEGLETTKEVYAFSAFERVFREFGLPKAIRTDNGVLSPPPTRSTT